MFEYDRSMYNNKQSHDKRIPLTSRDFQNMIDQRNLLFICHSKEVIEGEIVFHKRNAGFQVVAGLIWSLMTLNGLHQMYSAGFSYVNILLAIPTTIFGFYVYTVLFEVK